MNHEKLRNVPKKNYFILGGVLIGSLFLIYYLYMWYDAYLDNKLNKPIMDKYMEVINYNELADYLIENSNAIVYVSVLEDTRIRDFEKKFKTLFKSRALNRDILYMDITDEFNDVAISNEMVNKYSLNSLSIKNVPVIMAFDNGNLIAIYGIKENNYDIELAKAFINNIKFSEEDEVDG